MSITPNSNLPRNIQGHLPSNDPDLPPQPIGYENSPVGLAAKRSLAALAENNAFAGLNQDEIPPPPTEDEIPPPPPPYATPEQEAERSQLLSQLGESNQALESQQAVLIYHQHLTKTTTKVDEVEIKALEGHIKDLTARLDRLPPADISSKTSPKNMSWTDRVKSLATFVTGKWEAFKKVLAPVLASLTSKILNLFSKKPSDESGAHTAERIRLISSGEVTSLTNPAMSLSALGEGTTPVEEEESAIAGQAAVETQDPMSALLQEKEATIKGLGKEGLEKRLLQKEKALQYIQTAIQELLNANSFEEGNDFEISRETLTAEIKLIKAKLTSLSPPKNKQELQVELDVKTKEITQLRVQIQELPQNLHQPLRKQIAALQHDITAIEKQLKSIPDEAAPGKPATGATTTKKEMAGTPLTSYDIRRC